MNRKSLMVFLSISFFLAVLFLIFVFLKSKNSAATSLPYFAPNATPTLVQAAPTLVQIDPLSQKGKDLINDFSAINNDVEKVYKEDTRLLPPQSYFEKEVTQ